MPKETAKEEHEEYDPRVKADVVKHLVNMYNDAKKDESRKDAFCTRKLTT